MKRCPSCGRRMWRQPDRLTLTWPAKNVRVEHEMHRRCADAFVMGATAAKLGQRLEHVERTR